MHYHFQITYHHHSMYLVTFLVRPVCLKTSSELTDFFLKIFVGLLIRVGFAVVSAMGLENVEENATDDDGPLYTFVSVRARHC